MKYHLFLNWEVKKSFVNFHELKIRWIGEVDLYQANNVHFLLGLYELFDSTNTCWRVRSVLFISVINLKKRKKWFSVQWEPSYTRPWHHTPRHILQSRCDPSTPRWSQTFQTPAWSGGTCLSEALSQGVQGSSVGCPRKWFGKKIIWKQYMIYIFISRIRIEYNRKEEITIY